MLALVVALAAWGGGCSSGGTQVSSWKDPNVQPAPFKRIAVVGLSGDDVTRHLFEDTFSEELKRRGNDAVPGYTFLPKDAETNPDSALAVIKSKGFDAVLTARSMGVKTEETMVQGAGYYVPDSGYYGWEGYYSGAVGSTSYYNRTEVVAIETHLYQTATAKLVWGARSSTNYEGKLTEAMDDYSKSVVRDMANSGFAR
jgi:hypothetical protein